jgi:CMP/dCMP kinase
MIVAIDGPAGAGKSTVARLLAEELRFLVLDSGAFYRCYAYQARKLNLDLDNSEAMGAFLEDTRLRSDYQADPPRYFINDEEVTEKIRSNEVSREVSRIAKVESVRNAVSKQLREVSPQGDFVVEGRDIGSVVFPDAPIKFFLTASIDARASRRHKELSKKGEQVDLDHLRDQIRYRDREDSSRAVAPLIQPDDSILVDSTSRSVREIITEMSAKIKVL